MSENKSITESNINPDELVRLSFFMDIAKSISLSRSIEETLHLVMHHVRDNFAPEHWSLLLASRDNQKLKFVIVNDDENHPLYNQTIAIDEGIAGWVASNNKPLILEDVEKDKRFSDRIDKQLGFKTQSIIAVPLSSEKKIYGVIELINKLDGQQFFPLDLKILTTIAEFCALAIEKLEYQESLQKLALSDPLTGLYNKASFEEFLQNELLQMERFQTSYTLLMVNINHFQIINESFGNDSANQVIITLAKCIKKSVREIDKACRYSGDKFIIIMHQTPMEKSQIIIERVNNHIMESRNKKESVFFEITSCLLSTDINDKDLVIDTLNEKMRQTRCQQ